MEKLEKLPPCPKLCRGEECSGIPCEEEEPGFSYSHLNHMIVCQDKAHVSMVTRDGCFLFHLWPARKRSPKPQPAGPPSKNLGGGTLGVRHAPPNRNQKTGKPSHAGKRNGTQRQQQQQPRGQQQQQQRDLNHKRVIEKLNLKLEVARTNVLYANVVKGSPPFTTPPPPPPARPQQQPPPQQQPQPQPTPCSADDLERRQAFENLFTLYDSQHLHMMRIPTLQIGHNLLAHGPHVRPETPHVQREVPNNPGEVDNVPQEPGNVCRDFFDDDPLRGSEKRANNFPQKGFRCGSDRTGLFPAARGEKKLGTNSMKLLT
jgi:hypothetical protein